MQTRDRDAANNYVQIVEFPLRGRDGQLEPSEAGGFAAQLAALCDGPPTFRNLDVLREEQM
ncbi:MAG TPA: hypothetical protein VMQ81_09360 [Acidimicrobiia bacterium]|nr:hypothetical protein [Acidimicrobiia bacterium]